MKGKKLLLITFDYELFLGDRSGTVEQCLINPTNLLLSFLETWALKALFFVDTVYLYRLQSLAVDHADARNDLEAITSQLIRVVNSGHEIHPHIHPHWMDAGYNSETHEWALLEKSNYSFASVSEMQRADLFSHSMSFIHSILEKAQKNQSVDAYRAGGWSIQPFENFRPLFIQFGIKHEWSVIPGKYQFSDAHAFDFREAPTQEPVYRFDTDPCQIDRKGAFTEWTISSLTLNRFEKWVDFKISGLLKRLGKKPPLKGKTVSSIIREEGDIYCKKNEKRIVASFEGLNPLLIQKYVSAIRKSGYFQFISHPKLLGSFEFSMMEKLFRKLKKKYLIQTDFRIPLPE